MTPIELVGELWLPLMAMAVWEGLRRLLIFTVGVRVRTTAFRKLLAFDRGFVIAHSRLANGTVREADVEIEREISRVSGRTSSTDHSGYSIQNPTCDIVVIGSPRYNATATSVQQYFDLPFQFVYSDAPMKPAERRLSIVTEFSEELTASPDLQGSTGDFEVDYGVLLMGQLSGGRRILWLAGIHGIGTLGAMDYFRREAAQIRKNVPNRPGEAAVYLLRITYVAEGERDRADIRSVETIGSAVVAKRAEPTRLAALIMDFGNVLMDFDRSRTYRALASHLGRPYEELKQAIESSDIRERYELGVITTPDFCDALRGLFGVDEAVLADPIIAEHWGDIFWESVEMRSALEQLSALGVPLVLLSNTNELHFQRVRRDYPDLTGLFDDSVLSYEEGAAKPNRAVFDVAIDRVHNLVPDLDRGSVAFVDDREDYVRVAEDLGLRGFTYRSYPLFVYWLRRSGIYLD